MAKNKTKNKLFQENIASNKNSNSNEKKDSGKILTADKKNKEAKHKKKIRTPKIILFFELNAISIKYKRINHIKNCLF